MFTHDDRPEKISRPHGPEPTIRIGSVPRIVAVQSADSAEVQHLLGSLARRWIAEGRRISGVVEDIAPRVSKTCGGATLRNLMTNARYDLYQNLGAHSTACCLDSRGVLQACQDVVAGIHDSDLVVLSKFGKLEADRSGLLDAFIAAALLECPVLTSVSPAYSASYLSFVGEFGAIVPPDETYLRAWSAAVD